MKFSRSIQAIDSHTMGEPTRIVTGGIPNIKGKTMAEKKAYLENNGSKLVKLVKYEVGEGMEKRNDDFAAEVMSQIK